MSNANSGPEMTVLTHVALVNAAAAPDPLSSAIARLGTHATLMPWQSCTSESRRVARSPLHTMQVARSARFAMHMKKLRPRRTHVTTRPRM